MGHVKKTIRLKNILRELRREHFVSYTQNIVISSIGITRKGLYYFAYYGSEYRLVEREQQQNPWKEEPQPVGSCKAGRYARKILIDVRKRNFHELMYH